jgi:Flp pilus assembly protein TadD
LGRTGRAPQGARTRGTEKGPALWLTIGLALAGAIVYGNSLWGVFVFDDQNAVVGNPQIRQLWPPWNAFNAPANTPVAGRPIVALSLALNYAFGGLDPLGYHVWNLGVHILCGLALFGLVRRTLRRPPLLERFGPAADGVAAACALIWLVHPLQTEAVNYITQRTESTMALFYLLTLYAAIRALDAERPAWWSAAAVAACALGMASKEVMVTAPATVLLYDTAFRTGSLRSTMRKRWPLYAGLAATWTVLLALTWSGPRAGSVGFAGSVGAWDYALNQAVALTRYFRLAVWPDALVLDYGTPQPTSLQQVWPHLAFVGLAVLAASLAWLYYPVLGFLGAGFFLILAPTSSVIPIATEVAAERRMYLPLAALVALVVAGSWTWLRHRPKAVLLLLLCGAAGSLGLLSARRNLDYRSAETLWRTVVDRHPHWRAHSNLGEALQRAGRYAEAMHHNREALRLNPAAPEPHYNFAVDLERSGAFEEAIAHYQLYLQLRPDDAAAHNQLGIAFAKSGKMAEAVSSYRDALRISPDLVEPHRNLGTALLQLEQFEQAAEHFERFLARFPDNADVRNTLGVALAMQNRLEDAAQEYARTVQLDPLNTDARMNLGRALVLMGRQADADEQFREAVRLKPELRAAVAEATAQATGASTPTPRP